MEERKLGRDDAEDDFALEMFEHVDCILPGVSFERCSVDIDYLVAALELSAAQGGTSGHCFDVNRQVALWRVLSTNDREAKAVSASEEHNIDHSTRIYR